VGITGDRDTIKDGKKLCAQNFVLSGKEGGGAERKKPSRPGNDVDNCRVMKRNFGKKKETENSPREEKFNLPWESKHFKKG